MRLKKQLHYSAEAQWNHETGGIAQADGFKVDFDTPHEHGGNESAPCPDQLLITSLAGCIINTFNYYRVMLDVETLDLKVNVSSCIELTKTNGYRVTDINIEIQVWSNRENLELNQKCAKRAEEFCHLTRSIEKAIPLKTTIEAHI